MDYHEDHCYATNHGLEKWTTHMYEHLGWMTLAKKMGHNDKVLCYMNGIDRLMKQLNEKIAEVSEKDRKEDLKIILWKVECLKHTASMVLVEMPMMKKHRKTQKK